MNRRLAAMHPSLTVTYAGGTNWIPTATTPQTGWSQLSSNTGWFHETQIDLSGYAMDSLTFFPSAVGVQDPGVYRMLPGAASTTSSLYVLDLVTSTPINVDDIMLTDLLGNMQGPGMFGSDETFETILYGLFRVFAENSTIKIPNFQQLQRSQRFESGEPTAADKLYCYRIVQISATGALDAGLSYIVVPAARQLVAGRITEESELVYMQRLKRSYELANQVRA
jgi:hypothetical protein